ncbi:MAG TPA: hypothetical protein VH477_10500 [Bryobacteraceae bacterium]
MSVAITGAQLNIRISVGHRAPHANPFYIRLLPVSPSSKLSQLRSEPGGAIHQDAWTGNAGAGTVATATFLLDYPNDVQQAGRPMHVMWADLVNHSDADTGRRLSRDARDSESAAVKILFGQEKPSGFAFTAAQLAREKALWIPAYDTFITLDKNPVGFAEYQKEIAPHNGDRILSRVEREPEASYDEYVAKWSDMGSPAYVHPHQVAPGHIVCLSWDSAIPKFGIDRGSGVWNDYGNPDHFRFWFGFGDLTQGIIKTWKSQRLDDGLPIVTTTLEDDGVRYEVEQFAYPLNGPPSGRKGEISLVLLQKVRITNLGDKERVVPVAMTHSRVLPVQTGPHIESASAHGQMLFLERSRKRVLLGLQGADTAPEWHETLDYGNEDKRIARSIRFDIAISEAIAPRQSKEFVVKLPSPIVDEDETDTFVKLDYERARAETRRFWNGWLSRGAQFRVPEKAVNDLYRASLWHALRLPRRHDAPEGGAPIIDLPYSNFAYDQTGIPWPGVHSIYVDYMLYELRGYFSVALEELLQAFRLNQDADGHVSGFANWTMYTPALLYASGQYYLLSHDRKGFELLLPYALKAVSWCRAELKRAREGGDFTGLIEGPLNDGTGAGIWAINQAYLYAGLERFGEALSEIDDARAPAVLQEAANVRAAVREGFNEASANAPLVELRDHTWQPFVPSDARTPRRLMEIWYPTDVDTGPLHLLRLKALPADGQLADSLLNDHEDNLFLHGWGMANEPVYRPQGMAYLYRDDAKAAIRTFYSQLACAFSHTVFEPVEHRWMHGQYFGPPSTDGSWFELFRNLLIRETDDHTLLIGQAAPRKWLAAGQNIDVSRAPTYFGEVSFHIQSHSAAGSIAASVELEPQHRPDVLLVRLRHPEQKSIRSVSVNGESWRDFDRNKEWIRIEKPVERRYEISASY